MPRVTERYVKQVEFDCNHCGKSSPVTLLPPVGAVWYEGDLTCPHCFRKSKARLYVKQDSIHDHRL